MSDKPRVFISYPHADGTRDFVERLVRNLDLYADVFWDQRIDPGPFDEALAYEIESRRFFVAVMTRFSAREGCYCRQELQHARQHSRVIIPAQVSEFYDDELKEYTPARFNLGFDHGFQALTSLIKVGPKLPWEHFAKATNEETLTSLRDGFLPVFIAREVGEWVIIEQLWGAVEARFREKNHRLLWIGTPQTPSGVVDQLKKIECQIIDLSQVNIYDQDQPGLVMAGEALTAVKKYLENDQTISDDEHQRAGSNVIQLIEDIRHFHTFAAFEGSRTAYSLQGIKSNYDSNIADKIKALITFYSRRLRH